MYFTYMRKPTSPSQSSSLRLRQWLVILTLIVCSTSMVGCAVFGKQNIVHIRMVPEPDETHGVMRVGTNDPIPLTMEATDGNTYDIAKDVGGYCVVHEADLAAFVRAYNHLYGQSGNTG